MVNVSVNTKTCHNISLLPLRNSNNKSVIKPKKKQKKTQLLLLHRLKLGRKDRDTS